VFYRFFLGGLAMVLAAHPSTGIWTAVDLVEQFGAIPLHRVRTNPPPGAATERDVIEIHDRENRLCELLEGTLLEKTMGSFESYLALYFGHLLSTFVMDNDLGIVLGADGMVRLARGLVRIPDVSFISWDRLPGRAFPREDIWSLVPDLAVEVISRGNTRQEMDRKLTDYFTAGVRLVWYVYPATSEVRVYTAPDVFTTLTSQETLDGGDVLPGFQLSLKTFFAQPGETG
jgi:Uma2 family endonuclease